MPLNNSLVQTKLSQKFKKGEKEKITKGCIDLPHIAAVSGEEN
jgi:hypothetical protein